MYITYCTHIQIVAVVKYMMISYSHHMIFSQSGPSSDVTCEVF